MWRQPETVIHVILVQEKLPTGHPSSWLAPAAGWALLAHAGYFTSCMYLPCLLSYDLYLKLDETTFKNGMQRWRNYGIYDILSWWHIQDIYRLHVQLPVGMIHEWLISWCDATWKKWQQNLKWQFISLICRFCFFQHDTKIWSAITNCNLICFSCHVYKHLHHLAVVQFGHYQFDCILLWYHVGW